MKIEVHVHIHKSDAVDTAAIFLTLKQILEIVMSTQTAIDDLKVKVAAQTSVIESAKTLLEGLATQIRDNADDPEELNALADQLDANTSALSKAVTENTPTATPTP